MSNFLSVLQTADEVVLASLGRLAGSMLLRIGCFGGRFSIWRGNANTKGRLFCSNPSGSHACQLHVYRLGQVGVQPLLLLGSRVGLVHSCLTRFVLEELVHAWRLGVSTEPETLSKQ